MTPKLVYTLAGVEKTYTFVPSKHTTFHQGWEAEETEYKNPFTRERRWKRYGYYYQATITYEGLQYLEVDLYLRDFFNKNVTARKFYPNVDNPNEFYDVDVNDGLGMDDNNAARSFMDLEIIFRGTVCYPTPLNYALGYAGDRMHTIAQLADFTILELSGG